MTEVKINWEVDSLTFQPVVYAWSATTGEIIALDDDIKSRALEAIKDGGPDLYEVIEDLEAEMDQRIMQERNTELRSVLEYLYPEEL